MTTATLVTRTRAMDNVVRPRRSLEELVDRLMAALFKEEEPETAEPSAARSIHEARRLRQAGQVGRGAGGPRRRGRVEGGGGPGPGGPFSEWKQLVKRRFGDRDAVVYSQGTGRAAALVPNGDGSLEVAAVLGMRWKPGKVVSGRSLRGLRPLCGGA